MKRRQLLARLVLAPFAAWMIIISGFWFVVFVTPLTLFVILEWLIQMAKGSNRTFHDAWLLGWKDSLAQFSWNLLRRPLR